MQAAGFMSIAAKLLAFFHIRPKAAKHGTHRRTVRASIKPRSIGHARIGRLGRANAAAVADPDGGRGLLSIEPGNHPAYWSSEGAGRSV